MNTLEISQIIFNFTASVAIIIMSVLISIIAYDVVKFIRSIKKFSSDLNHESTELYKRLNNFLEGLSKLSFISWLFNKKTHKSKK